MATSERQALFQGTSSQAGYGNQPQQGYPPPAGFAPGIQQEAYQGRADHGYPQPGAYQPPAPQGGGYPPAGAPAGSQGQPSSQEMATAPPMEKMDEIAGYTQSNFDTDYMAPPPSYEESMAPPTRDATQIRRVPVINEAQAREALLEEVGRHCCWGKGPAENLTFLGLNSSSAFHYSLETFTEARTTKWAYEPYSGQPIMGIGFGPAPLPWDVIVPSPKLYVNHVHKQEVPHTASVKPCHLCFGRGTRQCHHCHGHGHDHCSSCNRTGRRRVHDRHEHCHFCDGRGRRRCTWCHASGFIQCTTCQGRGSLKCFIRLTVTWANHYEDRVVDLNNMPVELMRDVSGEVALQEENQRVWPINHFPDENINRASRELVQKHQHAYTNERTLMQRHKVRIIPVTEVKYSYKNDTGIFYVVGFEQKAHAPNYPSTCCGCCTIL